MSQQVGLGEDSHFKRHALSTMKNQLVENFFLSIPGTVVQEALACRLDDAKIMHVREMLSRSAFFCKWHRKNENATWPKQSSAIGESIVNERNGDMLENIARNQKPVFANHVVRDIRYIQMRIGMIIGVGIGHGLGQWLGIAFPITHAKPED